MNRRACLAAVCTALTLAASQVSADESAPVPELSAAAMLANCRMMLPRGAVALKGSIVVRNRKGIPQAEYDYALEMNRALSPAKVAVELFERGRTNRLERVELLRPGKVPPGMVRDTDVKWLDLSLDYLWWNDPRFEAEREGETVHGQKCAVIRVTPPDAVDGVSAARLWLDRKTGCVMQAEELDVEGKSVRRLWGTRVKKFDGRWMASVLEAEVPGTRRRTKITVDAISNP